MRNHLLQWFHEKNRRIEDGYDYEVMIAIPLLQYFTENTVFTYLLEMNLIPHRTFNFLHNMKLKYYCLCVFRLPTSQQNAQSCVLNPLPVEAFQIIQLCQYHHLLHLQLKVCIFEPQLFVSCQGHEPFSPVSQQ